MLSVIPAGIFSRLRIFLGRLKPHALPVARRHIVLGSIGAGTGLAVTSMFSHWLLGEVNLWFIAPMGASAVLLFGVPSSPLAQPWSIVGGNVLSALIGVTVGMLVPDAALACGLAAALAIAGMYFLRCLHPPGGAVALTAILGGAGVHSEGYHFVLTPVLLNSLMLALLAIVFNNLVGRRYPHPLAAEEVKSRAVPLGISVTREDIHAALLEGQFLDIDEDDVQELLENIEQQARQRIATAARRYGCTAGCGLQIAGKILRDPAAKAPVAFLVTDNRHHQVIAAQAAVFRQLLLQNGEEALLLRLAARAGIDPHHHQIPRAGQSEAGIFNHHMVGFVFMNNLVTVAFWYLEGA